MNSKKYPAGRDIKLSWECLKNSDDGATYTAKLIVENSSEFGLPVAGWAIYFNTCREIKSVTSDAGLLIEHVNGDLWEITPEPHFSGLASGSKLELVYEGYFWVISEADAPQGFFISYQNNSDGQTIDEIARPVVKPFSRQEQIKRKSIDQVQVKASHLVYEENKSVFLLNESNLEKITPKPIKSHYGIGHFIVNADSIIVAPDELRTEAGLLCSLINDLTGLEIKINDNHRDNAITLSIEAIELDHECIISEAYELVISPQGMTIKGTSAAGVFNAIQSLRQLMPLKVHAMNNLEIPCCQIIDAPRFAYRGLMLDVSRHFSSKETILKLLECMSLYKLNKFHFHLTDDEGWRLEIPSLPELTDYSSTRSFSTNLLPSFGSGPHSAGSNADGYYSRADFIDILRYAAERHINVIPEINTPGHARAAIKAMEYRCQRLLAAGLTQEAHAYLLSDPDDRSAYKSVQLWRDNVICIAQESYYNFLETVITDVKAMYLEAGAILTTWHTGGDEVPAGVWAQSPLCQAFMQKHGLTNTNELQHYSQNRYREILKKHDLIFAGWEEIALEKITESVESELKIKPLTEHIQPYVWNTTWGGGQEDMAYRLANAGYQTVLANVSNLYFDLSYAKDPQEPGYYWGGFVETRNVFEFLPLNIYATASDDVMGQPLNADYLAAKVRLSTAGKKNILGMQGHLWAENIFNAQCLEYFALPRMLALAERAWVQDPAWDLIADAAARKSSIERDWNEFANRLAQRELPRLDVLCGGFQYRIPIPGAKMEKGMLYANSALPGFCIRYTNDGSEPQHDSPRYTGELAVTGSIKLALFAGARQSRTVYLAEE